MRDLSAREWWLLAPIAAAVFWMGVYPESFMRPIRGDVERLLVRLERVQPKSDSQPTPGKPLPKAADAHDQEAAH